MKAESRARYFYFVLLAALFVAGLTHVRKHFIDYPVYENAAKKILAGQGAALYDNPGHSDQHDFYYAFAFGVTMVPFAWLGLVGKYLFYFLFFLAYLKTLRFSQTLAFRLLGVSDDHPAKYTILSCLVLLTLYAVNDGFMNANIGPLLLVFCLYAYEQREKRPTLSGFLLATAIVFKTYPVILLGHFIWEKRWRACAATALGIVGLLVGLPVLFYGYHDASQMLAKYGYVMTHHRELWEALGWSYAGHTFQSIPGTAIRYGSLIGIGLDTAYRVSSLLAIGLVIGLYLPSFLTRRDRLAEGFCERMFLLTLAVVPMVIPVSWYNVGLFYTPIIAYLLTRALVSADLSARVALALYGVLYCLTTPDLVGKKVNALLCFYSFPWMGVVAMLVVYYADIQRTKRLPRTSTPVLFPSRS